MNRQLFLEIPEPALKCVGYYLELNELTDLQKVNYWCLNSQLPIILQIDDLKLSLKKLATPHGLARELSRRYGHIYICTSARYNSWYQFKDHSWTQIDIRYQLNIEWIGQLIAEFIALNECVLNSSFATQLSKIISEIIALLQNNNWKEKVLAECSLLFQDLNFNEQHDKNTNLIAFQDGVLDLTTLELRPGQPDDCVTITSQCSIAELLNQTSLETTLNEIFLQSDDIYLPAIAKTISGYCLLHYNRLMKFLSDIFPDPTIREDVLDYLANILLDPQGSSCEQIICLLGYPNSGANGKSSFLELLRSAFGDYMQSVSGSTITTRRIHSNSANPELASLRGKRIMEILSLDPGQQIDTEILKNLCGGDTILARHLYREPEEFRFLGQVFLTVDNLTHLLPSLSDEGFVKRLQIIPFETTFSRNFVPPLLDPYLRSQIRKWGATFVALLIDRARKLKSNSRLQSQPTLAKTMAKSGVSAELNKVIKEISDLSQYNQRKRLKSTYLPSIRAQN